jgi:peroxiredoxin
LSQLGHLSDEIRALGARIAAIAVTASFSQMAFADALGVDFPLLSDWDGRVSASYGVQYREWKGHAAVAKRSIFIIDTEARVRYRWVTDDALVEPDLTEVMDALATLSPPGDSDSSGGRM